MTETCKECKYRKLCEEAEYPLDCTDENECEHRDDYLEAEEWAWYDDGSTEP